ncbi:MAG: N-acetyl-gamma-glutamyl-phosphate reductase [Actinomycetota bacterium]
MSLSVAVLGASGFAGAELLRIVEGHPNLYVVAASASAQVGRPVADAYPALESVAGLHFCTVDEALDAGAEVIFSSLPHTASMSLFANKDDAKIVDLAGDFRLDEADRYVQWYGEAHSNPDSLLDWEYGLTEFRRQAVTGADKVANPGCYPTAALLALLPLVQAGAIDAGSIHIDAKSGISGAGRAGGEGFDYSSVNESLAPYSVTGHKHIAEMEEQISFAAGKPVHITFIPHLVPMTRGILATCIADGAGDLDDGALHEVLVRAYKDEPFIRVLGTGQLPKTKRLSGTNDAEVCVRADARTGKVIAFAAIDNLVKGAAGQAVQNANLMCGLSETAGLDLNPCLP